MKKESNSLGFFLTALTLIFIFCKLTGHINWSWVWALSPMWIPLAIWLILMLVIGILTYFSEVASRKRIQNIADMQDRVNRKVADGIFNGEN